MSSNLEIYLNDHLAGAHGALELLDHLVDGASSEPLANFLSALQKEIEEDSAVLKGLVARLGYKESVVRKTGAWVAQKLTKGKFALNDTDDSRGLFQALESLSLGILGKRALWRTLSGIGLDQGLDYDALIQRAEGQFERVEAKALETARSALARD
ncbi:MAG TPA: hypothetical protein VGH90_08430 [Chthoniobacteraceae bacterium]|jgi:hypothetical protein